VGVRISFAARKKVQHESAGLFCFGESSLLVRAKKQKMPTSRASKDLSLLAPPLSSERSEGNPFAARKKVQHESAGLFCFGESSLFVRAKKRLRTE
jgi:hypothetical protein